MWVYACVMNKAPKRFFENSSPLVGLETTTSLLYVYVYKCMQRYIHLDFWDIIVKVYADIHMNMDGHGRQTPKSKYLIQKYIYVISNRQNERVLLIAQLASLFVWTQHTPKPLYVKVGAFRRKWRSISHIRYTTMRCPINIHCPLLYVITSLCGRPAWEASDWFAAGCRNKSHCWNSPSSALMANPCL